MNVFPDPRAGAVALLKTQFPSPSTVNTSRPASGITAPHLQVIWDGTPSEQHNRQVCAIAVIAFTPKGQVTVAIAAAQEARAFLLDSAATDTWRYRPGPGPQLDEGDESGLVRCEFTVFAETRPSALTP